MARRLGRRLRVALLAAGVVAAVLGLRMRAGPRPGGDEPGLEPAPLTALASWQPPRPRTRLGRAAAYAWAAPNSLAGLVLAGTAGGTAHFRDGAIVVTGAGGVLGRLLASRGFSATTLGHVILARGEPSPALLTHELCHTRQAERLGPAFGPVYLVLLAVYGYRRHPLERAARAAAQRRPEEAAEPDSSSGSAGGSAGS